MRRPFSGTVPMPKEQQRVRQVGRVLKRRPLALGQDVIVSGKSQCCLYMYMWPLALSLLHSRFRKA